MEDAALLRPESGSPLALTVDFITPIVDDPYDYGAIAAANSISDVYAMGATPQVALAICGFPDDLVSKEVLTRIFQGGRDKAAEAGCAIVGGHTVLDPELKYGLCVVGSVEQEPAFAQTGARPGDKLVLTKPIGSGIAAQAIKNDRLTEDELATVVAAMSRLNRDAAEAARTAGVRAATDVTGFGLLGHLQHVVAASGVAAVISAAEVPLFDFALRLAGEGLVPGGSKRNESYVAPNVRFADDVDSVSRILLCDAQTSGGLLLAVRPENEALLRDELEARGALASATIGEITEATGADVGVISVGA
jgi:selenide,water dikinase